MVTQACGMRASLMGCEYESYVIDDDMLGGILRSVRGIEADEFSAPPTPMSGCKRASSARKSPTGSQPMTEKRKRVR